MHVSRSEATTLAHRIYDALTQNGPVKCDFEEIEAFVLEAKPAVLIFDWTNVELDKLLGAFNALPFATTSVRMRHPTGFLFFLINVNAVTSRASRQPVFAEDVGWRHDKSSRENLAGCLGNDRFIGFVLGFPEMAIRTFEPNKRARFYVPFVRFKAVRFFNWAMFRCQMRWQGRRKVDVRNPDGYPIFSWIAFGEGRDPDEALLVEHIRRCYSRD